MRPDQPWPGIRQAPASAGPLSKTHSEILATLVRRAEWSAEDLATELYLSEGAVRSHVNVLAELGLVDVRMERVGPGRPRHLYSISSTGRGTFPTGYQHWLSAVLDTLANDHPQVYSSLPAELVASGVPSATVLAESASRRMGLFQGHMAQLGHQMRVTEGPEGGRIEVFNCGAFLAARAHPWLCEAECGWMQSYFPDRVVELEQCMTDGAATCVFALRPE